MCIQRHFNFLEMWTFLRLRCAVELAAHRGLWRQGHVGQRLAAELRRLGDLQDVVRRKGEDGGEGLQGSFALRTPSLFRKKKQRKLQYKQQ